MSWNFVRIHDLRFHESSQNFSQFWLQKKVLFLKKNMRHVSIREFEKQKSDFLNSNTCFCWRLYGMPFLTYLSGLKLLSYWVEPLSCLHSAHGPVLRQHVYYRVHKYSFQSPLNWHFWETLLNLFYPWSLWHLGLCHSWSYDRCGTCRLAFKRN